MSFTKRMAIIGGLGPHAGVYAMQLVLQLAATEYGAYEDADYPDVLLHSVPFKGSASTGVEDVSTVIAQEKESLRMLELCGARIAMFACNSSHAFLDQLQAGTKIEIVNLIEAAGDEITQSSSKAFGIMASQSTHASGLYENLLRDKGCTVITMDDNFQMRVNGLIAEAMRPNLSKDCIKLFNDLVKELQVNGAEAIIIGCTEISRLVPFVHPSSKVIDSLAAASKKLLKKSWNPTVGA